MLGDFINLTATFKAFCQVFVLPSQFFRYAYKAKCMFAWFQHNRSSQYVAADVAHAYR